MSFILAINTDNAAFEDDEHHHELARILLWCAERIECDGVTESAIMDVNGNTVGVYRLKSSDEPEAQMDILTNRQARKWS